MDILLKDLCIILINKMENYLINLINDSYNLTLINNKKELEIKILILLKIIFMKIMKNYTIRNF